MKLRIPWLFLMLAALITALPLRAGTNTQSASTHALSVKGTRFHMDGQPFPYTGLSFFNALYNPGFNQDEPARARWLKKFHDEGVTVLRVWCQWDSRRGCADAGPTSTLYEPGGTLRPEPLGRLRSMLTEADSLGLCVELVLFSHESWADGVRLGEPADAMAVTNLTHALRPYRNATFQIWNEHDDERVLPLVQVIKSLDADRLVTSCPGFSGVLGRTAENRALDYLTPHTSRQYVDRWWEVAPVEIELLLRTWQKPVVDDEPARNGTPNFGGPRETPSPFDHILEMEAVWRVGGYVTYHHDMFQTGYGTPAVPSSGIPDPDFSPYHRQVFDFLRWRSRYQKP